MLPFELTAIDVILVLSVIILLLLYMKKFSSISEEKNVMEIPTHERDAIPKEFTNPERVTTPERDTTVANDEYRKCPRGFGNIKIFGEDNSVSERCLGCYRIMDCSMES